VKNRKYCYNCYNLQGYQNEYAQDCIAKENVKKKPLSKLNRFYNCRWYIDYWKKMEEYNKELLE
jgi:hypothetical protein